MTLTIIVGDVGSGKTLLTTGIVLDDPRDCYSNYAIKIDRYHPLTPEMLLKIDKPSVINIDEAYAWLESRLSGRDINRFLSYVLFQSRKRELDFILTSQLLSTIDIRFRDMCNYLILAQKIPEGFYYTVMTNSILYRKPKSFTLSWDDAQKIFPYYDTMEIIEPIDSELMTNVSLETNRESMNENVEEMARQIMSAYPGKKITKGTVEDWLLKNNLPLHNAKYVYNRIRSASA